VGRNPWWRLTRLRFGLALQLERGTPEAGGSTFREGAVAYAVAYRHRSKSSGGRAPGVMKAESYESGAAQNLLPTRHVDAAEVQNAEPAPRHIRRDAEALLGTILGGRAAYLGRMFCSASGAALT